MEKFTYLCDRNHFKTWNIYFETWNIYFKA